MFPEGSFHIWKTAGLSELTSLASDLSSELYDVNVDFFMTPDVSPDVSFYESADLDLHLGNTHFVTINNPALGSDSVQTVSPKDIMVDAMSAPPSTTFTNMTTPGTSYLESPQYMADSTDTSPLFAHDNLGADADNWAPLFGDDNQHAGSDVLHSRITESPVPKMYVAPMMSRNGSSPGQSSSRSSRQGRHSFSSGVNPRRRDKPLPAITIDDPQDTVAVKRARNTLAARKSRQKRVERNDELVAQVAELERRVDYWKQIALSRGHVEH